MRGLKLSPGGESCARSIHRDHLCPCTLKLDQVGLIVLKIIVMFGVILVTLFGFNILYNYSYLAGFAFGI